ncbi:MAG: hypothetical protein OCU22_07005 [Canidatus Methanoxibalbensis ujae]|nr:hypothetical protein [Candidatus Methanoxibalbensis ujae]
MFKIMLFEGGVYRFRELKELIQDIGGFVVQEMTMQSDVMMHLAFPADEERLVRDMVNSLGGKLRDLSLAGTEIMVVSPSLGKHHLVHPVCDIAEFLRREGAVTNVMGLSRGVGKRISQMALKEREMIEECDAAVFFFGNFAECIREKAEKLCEPLDIPYVIIGGPPEVEGVRNYVGGIGRRTDRMRRKSEIEKLGEVVDRLNEALDVKKREIEEDTLSAPPMFIKEMIEARIPLDTSEELPIVIHLDGLRVRIGDEYASELADVEVGRKRIRDICTIKKSAFEGYLLKILPEAEVGSVF